MFFFLCLRLYFESTSTLTSVSCSVPQGSVLGPLLFILYTAELADIAEITLHAFADDNQLVPQQALASAY